MNLPRLKDSRFKSATRRIIFASTGLLLPPLAGCSLIEHAPPPGPMANTAAMQPPTSATSAAPGQKPPLEGDRILVRAWRPSEQPGADETAGKNGANGLDADVNGTSGREIYKSLSTSTPSIPTGTASAPAASAPAPPSAQSANPSATAQAPLSLPRPGDSPEKFVGMDRDELISILGEPTETFPSPGNGGKTIIYSGSGPHYVFVEDGMGKIVRAAMTK